MNTVFLIKFTTKGVSTTLTVKKLWKIKSNLKKRVQTNTYFTKQTVELLVFC